MQQFSHHCHHRLHGGFSASHESLKETSQVGLMTYGNQRRHVQSPPQMTTAPSANPRFLVDGMPEVKRIGSTPAKATHCRASRVAGSTPHPPPPLHPPLSSLPPLIPLSPT